MIFVADAIGNCMHIGREWETLTGQPISEALGLGWTACLHPEDLGIVRQVIDTAAASASEFSLRYRLVQADGQLCWVAAGCIPSFGPADATFQGYFGSLSKLAEGTATELRAYGNVGQYVPPPNHSVTAPADHLDRIADHLILAHSLIEEDGVKAALPGLREALFQVGRALAARQASPPILN